MYSVLLCCNAHLIKLTSFFSIFTEPVTSPLAEYVEEELTMEITNKNESWTSGKTFTSSKSECFIDIGG